ncbi:hypothetical protein [Collimonas arenae]|nr:hypothetical protein [Collimonas arenae]
MRRYIKPVLLSILLLLAGFAGGTMYGIWTGLGASLMLESTPKGVLAVANLKALELGKTEPLKLLLESDVDQALSYYSLQKDTWWYPLFKSGALLVNPGDYEGYIRRVANYRELHPSPMNESAFDVVPADKSEYKEEYKQMAKALREHTKRVNDTVKKYADK